MISIWFGGPNTTPTRINYAGDVDAHIDGIFNWSMLPRYIHTHTHTDTRMTSIPVLPVRRYFYAEKRLENLIKPMCCRFNWMPPCPALSMGRYSRSAGSCAACTHTIYMQMHYSALFSCDNWSLIHAKDTDNKTCSKPQAELKHFSA